MKTRRICLFSFVSLLALDFDFAAILATHWATDSAFATVAAIVMRAHTEQVVAVVLRETTRDYCSIVGAWGRARCLTWARGLFQLILWNEWSRKWQLKRRKIENSNTKLKLVRRPALSYHPFIYLAEGAQTCLITCYKTFRHRIVALCHDLITVGARITANGGGVRADGRLTRTYATRHIGLTVGVRACPTRQLSAHGRIPACGHRLATHLVIVASYQEKSRQKC